MGESPANVTGWALNVTPRRPLRSQESFASNHHGSSKYFSVLKASVMIAILVLVSPMRFKEVAAAPVLSTLPPWPVAQHY